MGLFNKIILTSLVVGVLGVGVSVGVCIDVGPSNATERAGISTARAAVEAPI